MNDPVAARMILAPLLALAAWTMLSLLMIAARRFAAAFRGELVADDFLQGESERVPPPVSLVNRHYMNLLEAPVLFYALVLVAYAGDLATTGLLALAWAYVVLRLVHSLIYLTYNQVVHRFVAFALSNVALTGFGILLALRLFA